MLNRDLFAFHPILSSASDAFSFQISAIEGVTLSESKP
jgi:hypothetical protein